MHLHRRKLLAMAGVTGLALLTPGLASAAERRLRPSLPFPVAGRCLVSITLKGGNDGLNTVVPLADPLYARVRPTIAISASEAIPLANGLAFHPALRPLMPAWDEGRCQVQLGVGCAGAGQSHHRAVAAWNAAEPGSAGGEGWLARLMAERHGRLSPSYALVFGDDHSALVGEHMINVTLGETQDAGFTIATEPSPLAANQRTAAAAVARHLMSSPSLPIFPTTQLGRSLQTTARLLASGVTPEAVAITHDGYDTHAHQRETHDALLADLATSLAAFRTALRSAGRWNDALVLIGSEFGRSARENAGGGTDHGEAGCQLALGGTVTGGLTGVQPALCDMDGGLTTALQVGEARQSVAGRWLTNTSNFL